MSGVVAEIEAAFEGERRILGIVQAREPGANETIQLLLRRRLMLELPGADEIIEVRRHDREIPTG